MGTWFDKLSISVHVILHVYRRVGNYKISHSIVHEDEPHTPSFHKLSRDTTSHNIVVLLCTKNDQPREFLPSSKKIYLLVPKLRRWCGDPSCLIHNKCIKTRVCLNRLFGHFNLSLESTWISGMQNWLRYRWNEDEINCKLTEYIITFFWNPSLAYLTPSLALQSFWLSKLPWHSLKPSLFLSKIAHALKPTLHPTINLSHYDLCIWNLELKINK